MEVPVVGNFNNSESKTVFIHVPFNFGCFKIPAYFISIHQDTLLRSSLLNCGIGVRRLRERFEIWEKLR